MLAPWPTRIHAATRMSDAIPRGMAGPGAAPGAIHSVYRSVVNVSTTAGLLSIASPANGGLPNGILVDLGLDFRTLGLRPWMTVDVSDASVGIPAVGIEIDLGTATGWSPRLPSSIGAPSLAAIHWRRHGAAAWTLARERGTSGGLGPLLWPDGRASADFGTVRQAGRLLDGLRDALVDEDRHAAGSVARGLIGLGPGLTPSGDDVLVGIEAALHALDRPTAGFLAGAIHDVDDRTTAIAATLLRHAAAGEFAERIHALMAALVGEDAGAVPAAIDRAAAWGASSGIDCLLGVLLGLDIASGIDKWPG